MHLNFFNLSYNDRVSFNRHCWDKRDILFKGAQEMADILAGPSEQCCLEINLFVGTVCVQKTNKNDVSQRFAAQNSSQTALVPIHYFVVALGAGSSLV